MREILFRAKETFNGEWVEGYYEFGYSAETEEPTHYMWVLNHTKKYGDMFIVRPETVGQYTGLTDKNGKKIFEGDIVKNEYDEGKCQYFEILYCDRTHMWQVSNKYGMLGKLYQTIGTLEVIGNIHDNPELLEGGE